MSTANTVEVVLLCRTKPTGRTISELPIFFHSYTCNLTHLKNKSHLTHSDPFTECPCRYENCIMSFANTVEDLIECIYSVSRNLCTVRSTFCFVPSSSLTLSRAHHNRNLSGGMLSYFNPLVIVFKKNLTKFDDAAVLCRHGVDFFVEVVVEIVRHHVTTSLVQFNGANMV